MPKYWGKQILSLRYFPDGSKAKEKEERKLVITMAHYALQRQLGGGTLANLSSIFRTFSFYLYISLINFFSFLTFPKRDKNIYLRFQPI